ncbi:hypothetical protein HMPREF1624_06196 [Sporothrix schenckii ATCC 58251]|uniref:HMG box domain-containing protein n=1 Tax=Sporothrix schenckii (strain ATCC 58251 / de Perez 2211183) TaxID=1391915 RepID=U7PQW0_SPOS1|nr:hypothetical protein HMPREF1624_06196 [Sporothrix schenckii ATCC 58251]
MDRIIPPSPTPSVREHSPAIFDQHLQHHSIASQRRCPGTPSEVVQIIPRSASKYQTPEPRHVRQYASPSMAYTQPHQGITFHYPALHTGEDAPAYETTHSASTPQVYNLNTPEASPPAAPQHISGSPGISNMATPQRATQGMKVLSVKTGRVTKNSTPRKKAPSLSASPPLKRKEKSTKATSEEASTIDQPLSILTKEWDMPIVDIEAYVHRSADERHEEVEHGKEPGKVKRAMNAFMLYRKAYQNRAKKWAHQSKHQIVSKVCAQSWFIEPDNVRQQFNKWAVIERDNHRKAHPEYKFTPSKPRKKGKDEFGEDSGVDDDWEASGHRDPKHRSTSRTPIMDPHGGPYGPPYSTVAVPDAQSYGAYHHRHPQQLANPARHTPTPYDTEDYHVAGPGIHYRHIPTGHHHQLENMVYTNTAQQGMGVGLGPAQHSTGYQSFEYNAQYASQAPVAAHHHRSHGHPAGGVGQQIDPSLMSRDGIPQYDLSNPVLTTGGLGESQWQPTLHTGADTNEIYAGPYLAEVEETLIPDNHLQYLQGDNESWKVDSVNEAGNWHGLGGA